MGAHDTLSPSDKLAAGRRRACQAMPYFRSAIMALIPKPVEGLGTFAVSAKSVLMWDPECAKKWSLDEIAATFLHEVSHLLRRHPHRAAKLVSINVADYSSALAALQRWNSAADAEIDDDLREAAKGSRLFQMEGEWVYPEHFHMAEGLTAEEYYVGPKQSGKKGKGQQGKGAGKPGKGQGQGQEGDGDGEPGGNGPSGPVRKRGACGGCAGNPLPGEVKETEGEGRSEAEMERTRKIVAEAIKAEAQKGRGNVPMGLQRWADAEIAPAKVDWRVRLARILRGSIAYKAGAVDLRWVKPSRRQGGVGFGYGRPILPAYVAPQPRTAIALDTSGSMGRDETSAALNEANGICLAVGCEVDFLACDSEVGKACKVKNVRDLMSKMVGGGGTDFRPVIEELMRRPRHERPDVLVYLTDGDGPAPTEPPPFKVIWVLVGRYKRKPAAWGEVIEIDDEPVSREAA